MNDDKVPIERVLDDMYDPNGGIVSSSAREYYRVNYATEEEKIQMDREDKFWNIVAGITVVLGLLFIFTGVIAILYKCLAVSGILN